MRWKRHDNNFEKQAFDRCGEYRSVDVRQRPVSVYAWRQVLLVSLVGNKAMSIFFLCLSCTLLRNMDFQNVLAFLMLDRERTTAAYAWFEAGEHQPQMACRLPGSRWFSTRQIHTLRGHCLPPHGHEVVTCRRGHLSSVCLVACTVQR